MPKSNGQYTLTEEYLADNNNAEPIPEELLTRLSDNDNSLAKRMELLKIHDKPMRRRVSRTYSIVSDSKVEGQARINSKDDELLEGNFKECLKMKTFVEIMACLAVGEVHNIERHPISTAQNENTQDAISVLNNELEILKHAVIEMRKLLEWLISDEDNEDSKTSSSTTKLPDFVKNFAFQSPNNDNSKKMNVIKNDAPEMPYSRRSNDSFKIDPNIHWYRNGVAGIRITDSVQKSKKYDTSGFSQRQQQFLNEEYQRHGELRQLSSAEDNLNRVPFNFEN